MRNRMRILSPTVKALPTFGNVWFSFGSYASTARILPVAWADWGNAHSNAARSVAQMPIVFFMFIANRLPS